MKLLPFQLGRIGKINLGITVVTVIGIYGFVLAKNVVDKQRYENMKSRHRMQKSNQGEYEPSPRKFVQE